VRHLVYFFFLPLTVLCQNLKKDTVFCDCEKARAVTIRGNARVGPTMAPVGGGKGEISESRQRSGYSFEKEHNSAWYKLNMAVDGNLCFEISPLNQEDDYDFMLFSANGKSFCDSFLILHLKPLRACISRNRKGSKGITGLHLEAEKELVREGPGEAFIKAVPAKKGEVYYLVVDNVHDKGDGHTIHFFLEEEVKIAGRITDENQKPLVADVSIINPKGDTIEHAVSDKDGFYKLEAILRKNVKYSLNYYNEETFFESREITTETPADTLKNIRTVLPTLKKGGKYNIRNINFYGGSPEFVPSAIPSVTNLYKLMKKNPDLRIMIVGHTNGCSFGSADALELSKKRAASVKEFLIKKSISDTRIQTEGRGCKEMLYPLEGPEWQQSLNRRVEIKVL
jgi:outer membrane protein OmpA-like peptidoglycan-associated protein